MWQRIVWSMEHLGPALALGLFGGRVLSEAWARTANNGATGTGLLRAFLLTLLVILLAVTAVHKFRLRHSWPLLFLVAYVFYPEPDPRAAVTAVALTLVATIQPDLETLGARRKRDTARLLGGAGLLLSLLVYLATIAPDILPADSGEFQLVATNLGVAHPPGFPLYTLLAHWATRLPFAASPALKVTLFSTLTSLGTLAIVYMTVTRLTGRPLAGLISLSALATATTFWSQATTANIRSLTGLFAALGFYFLLRFAGWAGHRGDENRPPAMPVNTMEGRPDGYLALFGLAFSLGVFHHASLLFMAVPFLAFILATDPGLLKKPGRWTRPLLAILLGTLPLLYLPWRGAVQAGGIEVRGASPALATLSGFLDHALALGFRGDFFYFAQSGQLWPRFGVLANVMRFQFSPPILLGMGLGLLLMLWRDRKLALLFGGSFGSLALAAASYRAPQTVEYMLPAYVPAAICLGYAVGTVNTLFAGNRLKLARQASAALAAILFMATVSQGISRFASYRYLQQHVAARDYAQRLLENAPLGTIILADWHWATPLWYLQEVEGVRPDVSVQFVFPTAEAYADTWARLIAEELLGGRPVIATHIDENAYAGLRPPEPVGEALLFNQEARTLLPSGFAPLDLALGDLLHIQGYRLDPQVVEVGQQTTMTLAWQGVGELPAPLSLFAHVVGADGQIYAQEDPRVQARDAGITLTRFQLTPRLGAAPGMYQVMVGAYGTVPLLDAAGESRSPVTELNVAAMAQPPVTMHPVYRDVIDTGGLQRLIGYDWDDTLPGQRRVYLHWRSDEGYVTQVQTTGEAGMPVLPEYLGPWGIHSNRWPDISDRLSHYVPFGQDIVWFGPLIAGDEAISPGQQLLVRQTFRSSRPVTRDIATSVRLIGYEADGYHWAWSDLDEAFGIPAMGAIPTLKWIAGSTVHDGHLLQVSEAAHPGQTVGVGLALYDAFTNRPLPVLDERFTPEKAWRLATVAP